MKKIFGLLLVLMLSLSIIGCGASKQEVDTRSDYEKFVDEQYNKAKNNAKEQGAISQNQSDKMDKAYNDVKDAVKSLGDLFGN